MQKEVYMTRKCILCKKQVEVNELKYLQGAYVCSNCFENKLKEKK